MSDIAQYSPFDHQQSTLRVCEGSDLHQFCLATRYKYPTLITIPKSEIVSPVTAPAARVLEAGWYTGSDPLVTLVIPEGVEEIGDHALEKMEDLTSVTLPSTLKKIGDYAFAECTSLADITLPQSLTEIGANAFFSCSELEKISIPAGVTVIPRYAFAGCFGLTSVTLPDTLTAIDDHAFYADFLLSAPVLPEGLQTIGANAFSVPSNLLESITQSYGFALKAITIPASVTEIGPNAFACQLDLCKVTFAAGSRLEKIGESAFGACFSLPTLDLTPCTVLTEIGTGAFEFCMEFRSLLLPASVTTFGEDLFNELTEPVAVQVVPGSPAEEWLNTLQQTNPLVHPLTSITVRTNAQVLLRRAGGSTILTIPKGKTLEITGPYDAKLKMFPAAYDGKEGYVSGKGLQTKENDKWQNISLEELMAFFGN